METVTISSKFQLVLPRRVRDRVAVQPGAKLTIVTKGGVIYLIPERPLRAFRGIARGATRKGLREKKDRL